jgi:hypothetical protein
MKEEIFKKLLEVNKQLAEIEKFVNVIMLQIDEWNDQEHSKTETTSERTLLQLEKWNLN